MIQGDLFNGSGDPAPACSAAALEKVDATKLERLTEQEFLLFRDGTIGDDIVHRLQLLGLKVDYLSIRPRVSELKKRGILVPTGTRRINRKGNTCAVLRHRDFL